MTISQFFILSSRGDSIISKDFRGDSFPGLQEAFFRKVKLGGDCPPIFLLDGINYTFIRRNGLFIACTTRFNVSPSHTLELLNRLCKGFKDYCGVLTEESIRKNFTLIYELLDEMIDYGYPQTTSTEALKMYIHNEVQAIDDGGIMEAASSMFSTIAMKTKPSSAINAPVSSSMSSSKQKNEIYVDIIEKMNVVFNAAGQLVHSHINGAIQMKSFLAGNPELKLALNEDLQIGSDYANTGASVVLDDCNFHECVRLDEFDQRTLHLFPPDGEFSVVNYRLAANFALPFRITPTIEEVDGKKLLLTCVISTALPSNHHGANVSIKIPVPRSSVAVNLEVSTSGAQGAEGMGSTAEYLATERYILWNVRKFQSGTEATIRAKISLENFVSVFHKKEIGPIAMSFEIPMYSVSNLQVRYLRIAETHKAYNPQRWVRYITQSSSYICRL